LGRLTGGKGSFDDNEPAGSRETEGGGKKAEGKRRGKVVTQK